MRYSLGMSDSFAQRVASEKHRHHERRRILVARRLLNLPDDVRIYPDPPDAPVESEAAYGSIVGRVGRLSRRDPEQLDLNGVPIGERLETMAEALKLWNASLPVELLRSYEHKIVQIKKRLRTPWPRDFSPEHANLQRELISIKARVSAIYTDRHAVRQRNRDALRSAAPAPSA